MVKEDSGRVDGQKVQKMLKFRTTILALDPHAKFFVDGNPLKVIHSKCGGQSTQNAMNDTSNFREHVGVCKGPHTSSDDNSSLKSSLRGGSTTSIHSIAPTPTGPSQLPCPGFNLEKLFGKGYTSLRNHEREQVARAAEVAGFLWLNPKEMDYIVSASCLKKISSRQEPPQPCGNCLRILELSNFKDTLRRESSKPGSQRFSPWRQLNSKTAADAGTDRSLVTDVSQMHIWHPTLVDDTPSGEYLVSAHYCQRIRVSQ